MNAGSMTTFRPPLDRSRQPTPGAAKESYCRELDVHLIILNLRATRRSRVEIMIEKRRQGEDVEGVDGPDDADGRKVGG